MFQILATALPWAGLLLLFALLAALLFLRRAVKEGRCPFRRASGQTRNLKAGLLTDKQVPLPVNDPLRPSLFADLQGNIMSGHGRDFAVHIFIRFVGDASAARRWLKSASQAYVTSYAAQQAQTHQFRKTLLDRGLFGHIAISSQGYQALGFSPSQVPSGMNRASRHVDGNVFADGMKKRGVYLLDPPAADWEEPYRNSIHAVIILAANNREALTAAVAKIRGNLADEGGKPVVEVLTVEEGVGLKRQLDPADPKSVANVEHFGYVDGISQPLFLEEQVAQERARAGTSTWDPAAPLDLVLVRDPLGQDEVSHGSFMVFRKLEQDVRGFNGAVSALAAELGLAPDLVGAMAVGRFKDGTPVVLQGTKGRTDQTNDFDFSQDPRGRRCPFQAHIRKSNPRGEGVGEAGDVTAEDERSHRIARRGIPYGGALTTSKLAEEQPQAGVGLLFVCYQADIAHQFEFIQRLWCNNPYFLEPQKSDDDGYDKTGLDPIIGQPHPTSRGAARAPENWPAGWGENTVKARTPLARFVTLKGGEYFFSPSMSFFSKL